LTFSAKKDKSTDEKEIFASLDFDFLRVQLKFGCEISSVSFLKTKFHCSGKINRIWKF